MKFGASMFFTDYSMGPAELAVALEERGFDIVWAPEHSHIPTSRKSSFILGSELPKRYYDVMDPFVTLTADSTACSREGCTIHGMTATSARDRDPLLKRQKSPNRNAASTRLATRTIVIDKHCRFC